MSQQANTNKYLNTMNTQIQPSIKTIDIQAKEWFDKVNGNSYFSAQVTVNYGMTDEKTYYIPFEYGYGSYFEQAAKQMLFKEGLIANISLYELKEQGIVIRTSKQTNCKKAEVKQFGVNNTQTNI